MQVSYSPFLYSFFIGVGDFADVPGDAADDDDDLEEEKEPEKEEEENRFKDIDDEALTDICLGNYKEYLQSEEFDFHAFKEAIENDVSKGSLILGVLGKLFDLKNEEIEKFMPYLLQLIGK